MLTNWITSSQSFLCTLICKGSRGIVLTVVGYANILDTVVIPQDPDYPRGLHTSDRARYIQERWGTQLLHFGPLTTGRQWELQGLTHTHTNCLKIHRQPPHTQAHTHTGTHTCRHTCTQPRPSTSAWSWRHLTSWVKLPSLRVLNAMIWTNGTVVGVSEPAQCTNQ